MVWLKRRFKKQLEIEMYYCKHKICICRTKDGHDVDARFTLATSVKDVEDGLKECTFTLKIPAGRHEDTGDFNIAATNKWGSADSSVSKFIWDYLVIKKLMPPRVVLVSKGLTYIFATKTWSHLTTRRILNCGTNVAHLLWNIEEQYDHPASTDECRLSGRHTTPRLTH